MSRNNVLFLFLGILVSWQVQADDCNDRILVAAVGDILIHDAIQVDAHKSSEGFFSIWKDVAPFVSAADVAYGNLEAPVAAGIAADGRDFGDIGFVYDRKIYSGTNMKFNFHPSVVGDLQKLGIDIVSTANNHSLDRKSIGIDRTNSELQKQGLLFTGTRMSNGTGEFGQVTHVKGKSIFWLACTEHLNGHVDRFNQVLMCFSQEKEMTEMIRSARERYDAVILLPHWGTEYSETPNLKQKKWAQRMADLGTTAIVGNHPHVLQPVERIGQTIVAYSLGNFVAWQKGTARKTSFILYLDLRESESGQLIVRDFKGVPVFRTGQTIYPAIKGMGSEAYSYVAKHLGAENIVLGQNFQQITRCQ